MLNSLIKFVISLINSKKNLLTVLLILFSIGSYTFSEITTHSINPNKLDVSSIVILKPIKIDFPIYYITPKSYSDVPVASKNVVVTPSEKIMDNGVIESLSLAIFLFDNNADIDFNYAKNLADLYVSEAIQEGVNPDLAFIQMCHETGFLRFNGTVDKSQNNYCGLGATGNGVRGNSFSDQKEGVRAHIQHLKAYGSTQTLANELVDIRFNYVSRGCISSLSELTGRWATDTKYDKKIRNLLNRLYSSHFNSETASI